MNTYTLGSLFPALAARIRVKGAVKKGNRKRKVKKIEDANGYRKREDDRSSEEDRSLRKNSEKEI